MTFAGQLLIDLVMPPIGAALMWFGCTGWLNVVYGGELTEGAKKIRKVGTLVVFVLLLVGGFGITLYAHFTGWRYRP
jgi:uncharacterized membrane protein